MRSFPYRRIVGDHRCGVNGGDSSTFIPGEFCPVPHGGVLFMLGVLTGCLSVRFYVDFATKVVTAERLLWERALKASSAEGDERQSSEAEAAFVLVVAPVMEKLVRNPRSSRV